MRLAPLLQVARGHSTQYFGSLFIAGLQYLHVGTAVLPCKYWSPDWPGLAKLPVYLGWEAGEI